MEGYWVRVQGVARRDAMVAQWLRSRLRNSCASNLKCVNGRGRSGGQAAVEQPKASPRPRQSPFAVTAVRELESACRVSMFLRCCHSTHGLLLRGSAGVTRRGKQQFAAQTLSVQLLGIQARKRHININFLVRLPLGRPPVCPRDKTQFVPGTNPGCPWDKPGVFSLFYTVEAQFVPGTNSVCPWDEPVTKGDRKSLCIKRLCAFFAR